MQFGLIITPSFVRNLLVSFLRVCARMYLRNNLNGQRCSGLEGRISRIQTSLTLVVLGKLVLEYHYRAGQVLVIGMIPEGCLID